MWDWVYCVHTLCICFSSNCTFLNNDVCDFILTMLTSMYVTISPFNFCLFYIYVQIKFSNLLFRIVFVKTKLIVGIERFWIWTNLWCFDRYYNWVKLVRFFYSLKKNYCFSCHSFIYSRKIDFSFYFYFFFEVERYKEITFNNKEGRTISFSKQKRRKIIITIHLPEKLFSKFDVRFSWC